MDVKALRDIFFKILSSELNGTELDDTVKKELTPDIISALFKLSKKHDLAHIVSASLGKNGILLDKETKEKYGREEFKSVYRFEQMKYTFVQICDALDEACIAYIPLKGSVIRPYYPKESMRTSCDIDILVKEEALDSALKALTDKGFEFARRNYHDVSLYSPNRIHLELHFSVQEDIETLDCVLKEAWLYAVPESKSRYKFTDEFFLLHIFAHISYHFLSGGCGIRSLMDIWVLEHKMGISYEIAKDLLEKAGIYKFASVLTELVDVCFSDKAKDEAADVLLTYILEGGVFGASKNVIAVKKEDAQSTFLYSMKRLFIPYRKMALLYPVLKKLPVLLPFCWLVRVFKMIFGGKLKGSISEIKTANELSADELNKIKEMRDRLGI